MDDQTPLDAGRLMNMSDRIEHLPAADVEWVTRLFQECLRLRSQRGGSHLRPDVRDCQRKQ